MADLLERWLQAKSEPDWAAILLDLVNDELMERLGGPHLQIGPSHFMQPGLTEEGIKRIWNYSIFPYIEEQLYGDTAGIKSFTTTRSGPGCKKAHHTRRLIRPGIRGDFEEGDVDDSPAPGMA